MYQNKPVLDSILQGSYKWIIPTAILRHQRGIERQYLMVTTAERPAGVEAPPKSKLVTVEILDPNRRVLPELTFQGNYAGMQLCELYHETKNRPGMPTLTGTAVLNGKEISGAATDTQVIPEDATVQFVDP
jgi:hypothetical protein